MKKHIKLLVLACSLSLVFVIYNIFKENNNKIYYIALGDSIAEGMNPYGNIGYSYSDYIKDYLVSMEWQLYLIFIPMILVILYYIFIDRKICKEVLEDEIEEKIEGRTKVYVSCNLYLINYLFKHQKIAI